MGRKGQINLEFLAAAFIYLGALGALVMVGQGVLPEFTGSAEKASLNLEARQVSTKLLTTPGRQGFTGGTNWHKNNTTVEHVTSTGLASDFKQVEREKINRLRTANPRSGFNYLNYTQFKRVTNADNQYLLTFTWLPVIETGRSFTRGSAPFAANDGKPNITEPDTDYYRSAANDVHYGSQILHGRTYYFLVTSHDGAYNTTYVSRSWDFRGYSPLGRGDTFGRGEDTYTVTKFQNRVKEPGALLMASQQLKTFGANVDSDSRVISMYRYSVMEGEPLRVKILAW